MLFVQVLLLPGFLPRDLVVLLLRFGALLPVLPRLLVHHLLLVLLVKIREVRVIRIVIFLRETPITQKVSRKLTFSLCTHILKGVRNVLVLSFSLKMLNIDIAQ